MHSPLPSRWPRGLIAGETGMPALQGPLDGVKVLELCQVMAGPTCGLLLADLDADVVKVETLPGGDDTRGYDNPQVNGESAAFLAMNRNKRSIALDLKQPAGQKMLKRLARDADVPVENFRKGTMEKFGLGYDALKAIMLADPHVLARGMVVETVHPVAGPTKSLGLPIKFTATPGGVRRPAPLHGEHTREVLREAEFTYAEIDILARSGAALTP